MNRIENDPAYCVEYFYAKPDCLDDLITSLLKLAEKTCEEPLCKQYELLLDNKNPNLVILLVKFATQEAMQAHEDKTYVKGFVKNEMEQLCEKVIWNDAKRLKSNHYPLKIPEDCENMREIRDAIDTLDQEIIRLLGSRAQYVKAAAKFKTSEQTVAAPDRVMKMLAKRREWAERNGLDPNMVEKLYRDMVNHFIQSELSEWRNKTR